MATIYDISRETGFSIATVSKVINNYSGVNENTRKVIKAKIEEMGFMPNSTARTLATKKSWMIAIVFEEEQGAGIVHPHYSNILQGFKQTAGKLGYDIIFLNSFLGEKRLSFAEHCRFRNVDGVLLVVSANFTDQIKDILDVEIPKVSVETVYPGVPTIISDNKMAGKQAMEHLYMLGHKKIATIAAPQDTIAGRERLQVYREFLKENNLEYRPQFCVEAEKYNKTAGMKAVNLLLQQCRDEFPTAIYAAYDDYACAAKEILTEKGFKIPEDMSIVGNDDLPIASYASPGITTVRQNRDDIGAQAAKILVDMIEKKDQMVYPEITRIPTKLIVRQTTFKKK